MLKVQNTCDVHSSELHDVVYLCTPPSGPPGVHAALGGEGGGFGGGSGAEGVQPDGAQGSCCRWLQGEVWEAGPQCHIPYPSRRSGKGY